MSLKGISEDLKKPTDSISPETLQEIVTAFKRENDIDEELMNNILLAIWNHLTKGFTNFDNQLLCSTSFFSVLSKSKTNEIYIKQMKDIISDQIQNEEKEKLQAISLIYGIFQSSYFMNKLLLEQNIEQLSTLLQSAFHLLVNNAYEYSQYTFITFKIMTAFKKVIGTGVESVIFNKDNQVKLLRMVNNNWENPITGVRNLNRRIFKNILFFLDKQTYEELLSDINNIYWNKAKYLMLAEIVEHYDGDVKTLVENNDWVKGVTESLYKPGLVSAGSDMYFAILKKIKNEDDWIKLFLNDITKILCGENMKAIENFSNYWCLATLKKFTILSTTLIREIEDTEISDTILYSSLCVLKHGVKLGVISKGDIVLESLKHCKPCIRIVAFEILCVIDKSLPSKIQYENVLNFLWENVNSDCTVLRVCMLNNLGTFLSKLHVLFLHYNNNSNENSIILLQSFCKDLQRFIVKSFNYDGNYQRKITTVQLTQIILKNLKSVHQKNKDIKKSKMSLMEFLQKHGVWFLHERDFLMKLINLLKDSASDIHENVAQILIQYYIDDISDTTTLNELIDDAISCINSKFFYEISCGQIIFKLIANILMNRELETKFKNIEDILNFALRVLLEEYSSQNIIASIENGKQLHSYINIIHVILHTCRQRSYKLNVPNETMYTLVDILQYVSNQFAWEKESKSSDFSRMNDMVQSLITTSGYDYKSDDETKISDQYQLVLNCLWLNVKASCDLSSLLIQYFDDVTACEKCLYTITNVLETSRHKGAIEAAGVAIGNAIRYLTSLPKDSKLSALPMSLLKKKLKELISETSNTISITRRGAGLSIMVHRIVSNDNSKGKPLFHYFMNILLSTCKSNLANDKQNVNKEDLPKAVYIHFLTKIVMDSSLVSDTMYYATELGEIAFQNLTDEHWQIRNAALQLYGALIPKLIGQKKSCGAEEESVITVACDEFRTHFPTLWKYILQRVETQDKTDILQSHSNLVPILNILSNMGRRYAFSCDKNQNDLKVLAVNLVKLLDSPIYIVRRLTSRAIVNISTPEILEQIKEIQYLSENFRHGLLLLVTEFEKYDYHIEKQYELKQKLKPNSFLCKLYYDELFNKYTFDNVDTVKNILNDMPSKRYAPGYFFWLNKTTEKYIENTSWNYIPELFKTLENYNEFANCCQILLKRLKNGFSIPKEIILELTNNLLNSTKQHNVSSVWEFLYHLSSKFDLHRNIDINILMTHLQSHNLYSIRHIVPLATRICVKNNDMINLHQIMNVINSLSNPETSDVDMRCISAIANNEIAYDFNNLLDDIKIVSLKTAISLLQDEDDDIRHLSSHFYSNIVNDKKVLNPFICMNKIMGAEFLQATFKDPTTSILKVCQDLSCLIQPCSNDSNKFNPFASDSKNIYMENNVLKELMENLTCKN
ncbi:uncharacterized protein LOC121734931 [Aricia agestis]|uniref:uncharacterized protein LOC121734931 n=1 Tax=Aricia agestis TaxID=91739 RepID=UPI001C207594|nr:uncharacterized protein LOC121734931 [Aricia agestis]